jgi:hypothetical protein
VIAGVSHQKTASPIAQRARRLELSFNTEPVAKTWNIAGEGGDGTFRRDALDLGIALLWSRF